MTNEAPHVEYVIGIINLLIFVFYSTCKVSANKNFPYQTSK